MQLVKKKNPLLVGQAYVHRRFGMSSEPPPPLPKSRRRRSAAAAAKSVRAALRVGKIATRSPRRNSAVAISPSALSKIAMKAKRARRKSSVSKRPPPPPEEPTAASSLLSPAAPAPQATTKATVKAAAAKAKQPTVAVATPSTKTKAKAKASSSGTTASRSSKAAAAPSASSSSSSSSGSASTATAGAPAAAPARPPALAKKDRKTRLPPPPPGPAVPSWNGIPIADLIWLRDYEHEWVLARKLENLWGKTELAILAPIERSSSVALTPRNSFAAELSHMKAAENGDLTTMGNAADAPILDCVRRRFAQGRICTWVKPQSVLLCVAPNCDMEQMCQRAKGDSPNVWSLADRAIAGPASTAYVMLGDSGSGKTEFADALLRRLVAKSRLADRGAGDRAASIETILAAHTRQRCALTPTEVAALDADAAQPRWREVGMEDVFLNCCTCLELFSHARTQTNSNASIFGRHLRVGFRHGAIVGAAARTFGSAASSRVSSARTGDRNFHVFYAMLRGLPPKTLASLGLRAWDAYQLLRHEPQQADLTRDQALFARGREALTFIGLRKREQLDVWRALAGILELGNLRHDGGGADAEAARRAAEHLGICGGSSVRLLQLLAAHSWSEGNDGDAETAARATTILIRVVYRDLFALVSQRVNERMRWKEVPPHHFVEVWDAFGVCPGGPYSSFKDLELLVVNFAAERMHRLFTDSVYARDVELYAREGLDIRTDDPTSAIIDSAPTCRVLSGVISQLRSMCSRAESRGEDGPSADCSSQGLMWGICSTLSSARSGGVAIAGSTRDDPRAAEASRFTPPSDADSMIFGVEHYRTKVKYSVAKFVERTLQRLPRHLDAECAASSNAVIALSRGCRPPPHTPSVALGSVSEVDAIATALERTNRVFLQCVQPNRSGAPYNAPRSCEAALVSTQLKAFGVLSNVKFARRGFLYRSGHGRFWAMCRARQWTRCAQVPRSILSVRRGCEMVLERALPKNEHGNAYFVGARYVLLKNEGTLDIIAEWSYGIVGTTLQRLVRGRLSRLRFRAHRRAKRQRKFAPQMRAMRLIQSLARAAPSSLEIVMRRQFAYQRVALRAVASQAVLAAAFACEHADVETSRAEHSLRAVLVVIESAATAAAHAAAACARAAAGSIERAENAVRLVIAQRADVVAREERAAALAAENARREAEAEQKAAALKDAGDLLQHTWRWIRARRALAQLETDVRANAVAELGTWMYAVSCRRELARWRGLMLRACSNGDLSELTRLLDCSAKDGFGLLRDVPVSELLDTRVSLPAGETPLLLTARAGNVQAVRVIVASGCSVDVMDAARTHVLHRLCALPNASAAIREVLDYASPRQRATLLNTDLLDAPNGRCIFTIATESGGDVVLNCLREFGVTRPSRYAAPPTIARPTLYDNEYAAATVPLLATRAAGAPMHAPRSSGSNAERQRALDARTELENLRGYAASLREQLSAAQQRRSEHRAKGDAALAARTLRQIGELGSVQARTLAQIKQLEQYATALRNFPKADVRSTPSPSFAAKTYGVFSDAMDTFDARTDGDSVAGGSYRVAALTPTRRERAAFSPARATVQSMSTLLTASLRALQTVSSRIDAGETSVATPRARDDLLLTLSALRRKYRSNKL